jgi:LysM domain
VSAGGTAGTSSVPVGDAPVRRRRSHTTYRRPAPGFPVFRPGGPGESPVPEPGLHRTRRVHGRCDDPRAAARAAAVRRRHVLLAIVAVAVLILLAVPWGARGDSGLATPGPVPVGSTLSPHTVYVVQAGDTLWSIAERLDPQVDPRPVMTRLSEQLGGGTPRPGERLLLP